jgi:hypothetical protein
MRKASKITVVNISTGERHAFPAFIADELVKQGKYRPLPKKSKPKK